MNLNALEIKENFFNGLKALFASLNVPVNYIDEKAIAPKEILSKTFKDNNAAYQLMDDVFVLGMVDNATFEGTKSETIASITKGKKDYDGILLFGVTLRNREKGLLPTRSQLAEITRAFNREFYYTPVVVVFRYEQFISIANAERITYKQEWREGEKAGKVSLLRDINVSKPHTGHLKILQELTISRSGKGALNTFADLYTYWQSVFNVSILNKKFYKELSDWYFWALQEVHFPTTNCAADKSSLLQEVDKVKEHNAKNLIRMLTRLLFVWFVKEKNLIPEELFDEKYIKDNLINGFEPRKKKGFDHKTLGSKYYRAILQNLFFATLNQTVGKREFRKDGQQMNVTNLMRYESYFKNPKAFIKLVENIVPFMNGGLFECLDSPDPLLKGKRGGDVIIYEDGFSDRKDNTLCVPDYIFFGTDEHADLSEELGDKKHKNITVNGLINILNSYKFTVTENTPIEEDIALDPELLGRVFENLLASYNPETKTTARKQTGSFYTPREIVNYMVDESLKAYLKQKLENEAGMKPEDAEVGLEFLVGYNEKAHLFDDKQTAVLINAIDNCKILDPACGSGAFPMGILHKLVHILHKLDPNNKLWKERQIEKAQAIEDSEIRDKLIEDIETAFESNELDYGRKLYLIENCIYGVDIQPIATQISKLRFFISLIVDQKANKNKENFGIRPLPNLETKFVAANTLIGIEKPKQQASLFDNPKVQALEIKLKDIRHRLFSAKTPATKRKLREEDQRVREEMGTLLVQSGWGNESAHQLAAWDPYNQNVSSGWFDPEWMFGIEDGFDVVISNPPYLKERENKIIFNNVLCDSDCKKWHKGKMDFWYFFLHKSINFSSQCGVIAFITSRYWINSSGSKHLITHIREKGNLYHIVDIGKLEVFEEVAGHHMLHFYIVGAPQDKCKIIQIESDISTINNYEINKASYQSAEELFSDNNEVKLYASSISSHYTKNISDYFDVSQGVVQNPDKVSSKMSVLFNLQKGAGVFVLNSLELQEINLTSNEKQYLKFFFNESAIEEYRINKNDFSYLLYLTKNNCKIIDQYPNIKNHLYRFKKIMDNRRETKNGSIEWFQLHWPRDPVFFTSPKVIIPSMFQKSHAAYTREEYYFGMGTNVIISREKNNLLYILCIILNSNYANRWFYDNGKHRGAGVDIGVERLRNFPLPDNIIITNIQNIFNLIQLSSVNITTEYYSFFKAISNSIVNELYFPEQITKSKADILKHLTNLPELKDDWSDEKKMNTIKKVYQELSNPKHPVSIAMERQKTVKEVRIIEGLPALSEVEGDK